MPALESRGSLSYTQHVPSKSNFFSGGLVGEKEKVVTIQQSTENVVFLFISDIGADRMMKLILKYGDRSAIPQTTLRNEVRLALDAQWERLRFGKVVKEVVPYLPMEPEHIYQIFVTKLATLAADNALTYWRALVVDSAVVAYLSGPQFIRYSVYSVNNNSMSSSQPTGGPTAAPAAGTKVFATWGARALENAGTNIFFYRQEKILSPPIIQFQTRISPLTAYFLSSFRSLMYVWFHLCVVFCICSLGPLRDLRILLNQRAQPWRPSKYQQCQQCL
jgi:hypothetical protein